jgi:hypothetical protein
LAAYSNYYTFDDALKWRTLFGEKLCRGVGTRPVDVIQLFINQRSVSRKLSVDEVLRTSVEPRIWIESLQKVGRQHEQHVSDVGVMNGSAGSCIVDDVIEHKRMHSTQDGNEADLRQILWIRRDC